MDEIYTGIDIGTTEVRCVIGRSSGVDSGVTKGLKVIGYGSERSNGLRKGVIVHPHDVIESVNSAIDKAERMSGAEVRHATISVNGSHLTSHTSRGVIAVSGSNGEISEEDRLRAEEASTVIQMPANLDIVQVFPKDYCVDGQAGVKNPVGMQGVRLEVESLILAGSRPLLKEVDEIAHNLRLGLSGKCVTSLASAEALMSRQDKENATAVVNIGHGTTNLIIMDEGEVIYLAVVAIGSMHLTSDLAIGLKTEIELAEKVKLEHGDALGQKRGRVTIKSGGTKLDVKLQDVSMIMGCRLDELFDKIDSHLQKVGYSKKLPGGVILTGGGSKLPGLVDFAKEALSLPVRTSNPKGFDGVIDKIESDPRFSAAVGLTYIDMLSGITGAGTGSYRDSKITGAISALKGLIGR